MSDDLVNRTLATTMPKFFKGFQDAMANMSPEYWWAVKNGLFTYNGSGKDLQWRVRLARGTPFGWLGGMESQTLSVRNDYQIATADWRGMAHGIVVTKGEVLKCKGREEIIKLVPTLLADMRDDLIEEFGTAFYSDGSRLSSKQFHGLGYSVVSSGTVYGISTTSFTNWAAQVLTGTGFSADPLTQLLDLQMTCAVGQRGGRTRNQIDIFLCHPDEYQTVASHEAVKQRYTQNVEMAKAGFKNIEVWGVPLTWSTYCTADTIFGLNSNLFEFIVATDELFDVETEWTHNFPKVLTGTGVTLLEFLNKSPRGSGKIQTIT